MNGIKHLHDGGIKLGKRKINTCKNDGEETGMTLTQGISWFVITQSLIVIASSQGSMFPFYDGIHIFQIQKNHDLQYEPHTQFLLED